MDQICIKTPNPKCRLFLKMYQQRYLAAGVYLSEAPSPLRFSLGVVRQACRFGIWSNTGACICSTYFQSFSTTFTLTIVLCYVTIIYSRNPLLLHSCYGPSFTNIDIIYFPVSILTRRSSSKNLSNDENFLFLPVHSETSSRRFAKSLATTSSLSVHIR
jgi:hypothetical protein